MTHGCRRDPYLVERDLATWRQRQFPALDLIPDLSRGEVRFAVEALVATTHGEKLPESIMERALSIASVMARG